MPLRLDGSIGDPSNFRVGLEVLEADTYQWIGTDMEQLSIQSLEVPEWFDSEFPDAEIDLQIDMILPLGVV